MLKQIIHIGVTITDTDRSIAFYRDILGLKHKGEIVMKGEATDRLFRRENCVARVNYLEGSDLLKAPPVELIEFINPKVTDEVRADLFRPSISEICFHVDDIDAEYRRLSDLGVEFLSEPQFFDFTESNMGCSKAVYFKDPDGIILELLQPVVAE